MKILALILIRTEIFLYRVLRDVDLEYRREKSLSEQRVSYTPLDIFTRFKLIRFIKREQDNGRGDVRLLDVGCGKCHTLLTLRRTGIDTYGLEYDSRLYEIANSNCERLGYRDIVTCGDAVSFNKYSSFDCIYLYNPFNGDLMKQFVNRLIECGFKGKIIYVNSVDLQVFHEYEASFIGRDIWGNPIHIIEFT